MMRPATFASIAWLASAAVAHAEGTLGLDEVLIAVAKAPKLVTEIQAELGKTSLKATDITCIGARHGNQWTYLGGGRAAPYECEIGKRTLSIEADRIYFDARGRSLGNLDKADPKRAKTFQESNFRWTWSHESRERNNITQRSFQCLNPTGPCASASAVRSAPARPR